MGASALLSGLPVPHHRRAGGEEYGTRAELVHVLALFVSVFWDIYSFFGWFFYA